MKKGYILLGLLAGGIGLTACSAIPRPGPVGNAAVPQPAKSVDLARYLGRWYEQYRYEASFQKNMEAVTADYSLNTDGSIKVVNRGRKDGINGTEKESVGRAKVVDETSNAKLKVSFFGPFYGNYWIMDHADDYSWSIVGEPSGRYLWVLTREAHPSAETLTWLQERVKSLGYDWSLTRRTLQPQ